MAHDNSTKGDVDLGTPMEVDGQVTEPVQTLVNTVPRNAPVDVKDMTVKEEKEYHRRCVENDYVKGLQLRIDEIQSKLIRAQENKHAEVVRINRRRKLYDDKIQTREERKVAGRGIRKRQREEAAEKEEMLETLAKKTKTTM